MPRYAIFASYTPESWARMIDKPADRVAAVRKAAESAGGRLDSLDFAFGDFDALVIVDMPDAASAAAVSVAVASTGALSRLETRVLIEPGDMNAILAKAKEIRGQYRAPGT